MATDYPEPRQVLTSIVVPAQDVVSLLEQINISTGTWCSAINLANAFFLVPVYKGHQKQFVFNWQGHQYTFTALFQEYINSLAPCLT